MTKRLFARGSKVFSYLPLTLTLPQGEREIKGKNFWQSLYIAGSKEEL
jgi:hypothetical protein